MVKVAIYPGHIGKDSGAIDGIDMFAGDNVQTIEAVVTWGIADKVAGLLCCMGINRTIGIGTFDNRIEDTCDCSLGVSIHADVFDERQVHGFHVIHYPRSTKGIRLAAAIDESMSVIGHRNRKPWPNGRLAILRETCFPCVLVECGFLSNPEEEKALMQRTRQYRIAWAIVDGIMRYVYGKE